MIEAALWLDVVGESMLERLAVRASLPMCVPLCTCSRPQRMDRSARKPLSGSSKSLGWLLKEWLFEEWLFENSRACRSTDGGACATQGAAAIFSGP